MCRGDGDALWWHDLVAITCIAVLFVCFGVPTLAPLPPFYKMLLLSYGSYATVGRVNPKRMARIVWHEVKHVVCGALTLFKQGSVAYPCSHDMSWHSTSVDGRMWSYNCDTVVYFLNP